MKGQPLRPAFTIRPYRDGDERELVTLFRQVFGKAMTEAQWRWKLKRLPSPVENVRLAVDGTGKPIFQYAGIPIRYLFPWGEQTVMVGVDTMTDPAFRRQGLLTAVARSAYDAWRAAGIPCVLGLPNQQWGSRTRALGWEDLLPLRWLIRPLRPEAVWARRVRLPPVSRFTPFGALWNYCWNTTIPPDGTVLIRPVENAGPEFDALWQTCRTNAPISAVRDSAWVNWRYLTSPGMHYRVLLAERSRQPVGYVVYRTEETGGKKTGYIAELVTKRADTRAQRTLLARAVGQLRSAGAEVAATLASPGTELYRLFRRAGFLFSWGAFQVQLVPLDAKLPLDTLRNPQHWYLSGADFDVI